MEVAILKEQQRNKVSEKVYNFMIDKIRSKEWLPDTKIMTEKELCEERDSVAALLT